MKRPFSAELRLPSGLVYQIDWVKCPRCRRKVGRARGPDREEILFDGLGCDGERIVWEEHTCPRPGR